MSERQPTGTRGLLGVTAPQNSAAVTNVALLLPLIASEKISE